MTDSDDSVNRYPDIANSLAACLSVFRSEHEETFADPETPDERSLQSAMDKIESSAFQALTTLEIPPDLGEQLTTFMPGSLVDDKLTTLLSYNFVQDRIAFDIADDVIEGLEDVGQRVRVSVVAFMLLQRSAPSPTALKYLERALRLYLAGYTTETFVMCGAVIEAALATRFPNSLLQTTGVQPDHSRTGDYSISQRMRYAKEQHAFGRKTVDQIWELLNWRNDAVHVQPDIVPGNPAEAVLTVGILLGRILPKAI